MRAYEITYTYALKLYSTTIWATDARAAVLEHGRATGETVTRVVAL